MRLSLTATHPRATGSNAYPYQVPLNPEDLRFGQKLNGGGSATFKLRDNIARYLDEYDADNPLPNYALIVITDVDTSTVLWRGYVYARFPSQGETNSVSVQCVDKYTMLQDCLAARSSDGRHLGEMFLSPALTSWPGASTFQLTVLHATDYPLWYYASPSAKPQAWLLSGLSYAYLGVAAGAADTELYSEANYDRGFPAQGVLKCGTEYIYYDGYSINDAGAGSVYVFRNCSRGCFGSTAAVHLLDAKLDLVRPLRIHPTGSKWVSGLVGAGYEDIDQGNYKMNVEEGRIEFDADPLGASPFTPALTGTATQVWAFYNVYDEAGVDAAPFILCGSNTYGVLELLLQTAKQYGGPELATSGYDLVLDNMVVPRVYFDTPLNLGPALASLLESPGSQLLRTMPTTTGVGQAGVPRAALGSWWAYATDKLTLRQLPLTTAATTIRAVSSISEQADSREAYTGVCAYYQDLNDGTVHSAYVFAKGSFSASGGGSEIFKSTARITGDLDFPRVKIPNLGACGQGAAQGMARGTLLQSLALARSRHYTLRGCDLSAVMGGLANNYTMPDAYSGTLAAWECFAQGGVHTLSIEVQKLTEADG